MNAYAYGGGRDLGAGGLPPSPREQAAGCLGCLGFLAVAFVMWAAILRGLVAVLHAAGF